MLRLSITFCREPKFYFVFSEAGHAIIDNNTNKYLPCWQYYNTLLLWSLIVVSATIFQICSMDADILC